MPDITITVTRTGTVASMQAVSTLGSSWMKEFMGVEVGSVSIAKDSVEDMVIELQEYDIVVEVIG